jgi:hypothetical protein
MSAGIESPENTGTAVGLVEYLIVEFPVGHRTGENLPLLVDLVDRGLIRVLDLIFIKKHPDGMTSVVELADLDGDGELDLAVFEGASSGILGADDLDAAGGVLEPGASAAVVVYENRWAAPLLGALHHSGARVVAGGLIPQDALVEVLDAAEATGA